MADIVELERRISAALARISEGLDRRATAPQVPAEAGDAEGLAAALEEERMVNAQLTERLRVLKAREAADPVADDALEVQIENLTRQLDTLGAEVVRLRKTSAALREELTALRGADVPDAHLINRAMLAELEALRAERSAESAELAAILAELEPLTAAAKSED